MKITKTELKSIVKECLVEILSEGIGGGLGTSTQNISQKMTLPKNQSSVYENSMTQQAPLQLTSRQQSPQLREAIKREAGGNKVMESILADTASSTLQKMLQNEGRSPIPAAAGGGLAEHVVASANPEDLFGDEVSSKWASLAFMDSPQRSK